MFPGTIDWSADSSVIVADITDAPAGAPKFAYLMGARIGCHAADLVPPPAPVPSSCPGQIIAIDPAGPFWVIAGDGRSVRISRYQIDVYVYATDRLDRLTNAFGLSLPVQLSQIPFLDGRDATVWERGVRAWNAPAPDWQIEPIAHGERHPTQRLIDLNRPFFHSLFALLGITRGCTALDVGCGDGWAMSLFQEFGLHCAGFDVAPQSLRIARRYVPDAQLTELDYYVAGDYYATRNRTFDFIFCRSIGAAQKQIDWFEPSFLAASRGLADRLEPGGYLYWQQHSDRSGQIGRDEGFANTPLATVLAHFDQAGLRPLLTSAYGGIYALVLVRHDFPEKQRAAIEASRTHTWQVAMASLRRDAHRAVRFSTVVVGPETAILNGYRTAISHLSTLFRAEIADDRHQLIIVGTDTVARLYVRAAATMHLPVICFWDQNRTVHTIDGIPVERVGWQPNDSTEAPTAIVIADPSLRAAARATAINVSSYLDLAIDLPPHVFGTAHPAQSGSIYLFSGDQDHNLAPAMRDHLAGVAEWLDNAATPAPTGIPSVHGTASNTTIDASATGKIHIFGFDDLPWTVSGKGHIIRSSEGIGMTALAGDNVDLTVHEERGISHFAFEAWVRRQSGREQDCRVQIQLGDQEFRLSIGLAHISLDAVGRTTLWRRSVVHPLLTWHGTTVEWRHVHCTFDSSGARLTIDDHLIGQATMQRRGRTSPGSPRIWQSMRIGLGIWGNSQADTEIWWRDISISRTTPD